jgi:hypothetical protein
MMMNRAAWFMVIRSAAYSNPANRLGSAIEMKKKRHKKADKDADRKRLIALTMQNSVYPIGQLSEHVSCCELGLFIELDVRGAQFLVKTYRAAQSFQKQPAPFKLPFYPR